MNRFDHSHESTKFTQQSGRQNLSQDSKVGSFYEMRPVVNYSQSLEFEISESAIQAGADRFACMHVGYVSRMADSASSLAAG